MPFIRKVGHFCDHFYIKLDHLYSKVGKKVVILDDVVGDDAPFIRKMVVVWVEISIFFMSFLINWTHIKYWFINPR